MNIKKSLYFISFALSHDKSIISHLYKTASIESATVHQKLMNISDSQEVVSF